MLIFFGASKRTRTPHNSSEDYCDIHFTMGAYLRHSGEFLKPLCAQN